MTDQKHTKEPWKISDDPDYPEAVILAGETMVADANIFGAGSSKKINMANAKRIVECVNACAGIESPLDLRRQRDEAIKLCSDLIAENAGLKNSRDELRNELTKMQTFLSKLNLPEKDFMKWTETLDEHPEEYDGPCNCYLCLSYANY